MSLDGPGGRSQAADSVDLSRVRALPSSEEHVAGVDVGGTRFRGWLATRDRTITATVEYRNTDLGSLTDGLVHFLLTCGLRPARLCLGITGDRRVDGTVHQPNVPAWWPDFNWIQGTSALGVEILPMNDMGVAALGAYRLRQDPRFNHPVLPGVVSANRALLAVGFGTGLGDAFVDGDYVGQGEAGHQPFSPRDETEDRLLRFARKELDSNIVSFEDVLSGSKGLLRLYRFYCDDPLSSEREFLGLLPEVAFTQSSTTAERLQRAPGAQGYQRPAEVIMQTGLDPASPGFDSISFLSLVRTGAILGTYLGARGIAVCPLGGIKLMGGVLSLPLIELWQRHSAFEDRIRDMGVHAAMASVFQVDWVTHPYPGLVGAIEAALLLEDHKP